FLDALVKDKKTNLPISNLSQNNFEVFDDGKPRPISYFTREGEARKPLALVLVLDLRLDGAGRFLKEPEILKAMENELAKLPPGDEVAIMAMNIGEDDQPIWLSEFTNDRTKVAAALMRVQQMCENPAQALAEAQAAAQNQKAAENSEAITNPKEVLSTETIKGKNGATITRKTLRDGSVSVERVSKDGKMTVDIGEVY